MNLVANPFLTRSRSDFSIRLDPCPNLHLNTCSGLWITEDQIWFRTSLFRYQCASAPAMQLSFKTPLTRQDNWKICVSSTIHINSKKGCIQIRPWCKVLSDLNKNNAYTICIHTEIIRRKKNLLHFFVNLIHFYFFRKEL